MKRMRIMGIAVFTLGALLALGLIVFAVWGDTEGASIWGIAEAANLDISQNIQAKITTIKCPVFINPNQSGVIRAVIKNQSDQENQVTYQIDVSHLGDVDNIRTERTQIVLSAGEVREISWNISPQDQKYEHLILTRVYLFRKILDGPADTKSCGVFVADLRGMKNQVLMTVIPAISLVLMVLGSFLWHWRHFRMGTRSRHFTFAMNLLLVLLVAGLFSILFGFYLLSVFCLVFILILVVSMAELFLLKK